MIDVVSGGRARTLLELGSGGGNNASHPKASYACTLTDRSPEMLELSRSLTPECEHVHGDMRTLRLGRSFDAVFVHDALMYLTSEDDLAATDAPSSTGRRGRGSSPTPASTSSRWTYRIRTRASSSSSALVVARRPTA